jgi:hypothetical protein
MVNSENADGSAPFCLASQGGLAKVTRVLLGHGADLGKMPSSGSESLPFTSSAHTLADLPIPSHRVIPH